MKYNKAIIWALVILVVVTAVYRVLPGKPLGFAPQLAVALFAGAVIKNKTWSIFFAIISMVLSDLLFEGLYAAGLTPFKGFYEGQWINYLLFASVAVFGWMIKKITVSRVLFISLIAPVYYFLISNFLTWAGVGEYVSYPKTFNGLMASYAAGLPFFKGSVMATIFFSGLFFGSWYFIYRSREQKTVTV